jgi:hypothetical protein
LFISRWIADGRISAHNGGRSNILGGSAVQALVEIIAGLVAMLAAAALSLFGVDMNPPQKSQPEVHRVRDCGGGAPSTALLAASNERADNC